MKIAVIGSRSLKIDDIGRYLPENTSEIITGGAKGIDKCAEYYANENGIKLTVFLPEYERYGRAAPIKRNAKIIENADEVIAFWDGKSRGTLGTIENCKKLGIKLTIHKIHM